ncbi:MAG: hypothetical protein IPO03_13150 [Bacteroidetes bacterium]|jgi:hypothetical protein|nr:hypothetical protein [Bacteroidota bacterium]
MQEFLIPAVWATILLFFIYRFDFFKIQEINPAWPYAAFLFKLLLGFANYYIWLNIIGHGDSLRYFHDSQIVYQSLFDNPTYFFELITRSSLENIPAHLIPYQKELFIEWHVNEYHMVRLLAILNVFTFGNVWANIVLIAFGSYAATMGLFKSFKRFLVIDADKKNRIFLFLFFLPSIVFWTGGLLKEAPVFMLLCVIIIQLFTIESSPNRNKTPAKPLLILVVCIYALFLIRDYLAILVSLNLLLLFFARTIVKPQFLNKTFIINSITVIVLFFAVPIVFPQLNYFHYAQSEQTYFLNGEPDPDYKFSAIGGNGIAVIKQIPYALNNIFFRPNLMHSDSVFRLYQSVELIIVWLIIVFLAIKMLRQKHPFSATALFMIIVAIELLGIYGLMVTDADTLSRYRSIPLFFILLFMWLHKPKHSTV